MTGERLPGQEGATEVAVAVLIAADGRFLLARRPEGKPYAGYWEFPGGKVEAGETHLEALEREIKEELGVRVKASYPWLTQTFTYPHATVRLRFFRVYSWEGAPSGREGQQLSWESTDRCSVTPLLPANFPILKALGLPTFHAISYAEEIGIPSYLDILQGALRKGLRMVQVRDKSLPNDARRTLATQVAEMATRYGARVVINDDPALAAALGVGLHVSARQLMALDTRPDNALCGASCHNRSELEHAAALGLDYALLGPVSATKSHPDAIPLGWSEFSVLSRSLALPVYALGGLTRESLVDAMEHGAHGIAMMRAVRSFGEE